MIETSAHIYTAHLRDEGAVDLAGRAAALRVAPGGFSWAAFAFGPLWLATKSLWVQALGLTLTQGALIAAAAVGYLAPAAELAGLALVALFVGLEAREWVRRRLARAAPIHDIVVAPSRIEAEAAALRRLAQETGGGA